MFKSIIGTIILFLIGIFGLIGWILNIISIFNTENILSGVFVIRAIGVFMAPLGSVMGYL